MPKEDLKELLATSSKDKWKEIGLKKRAGILAPLFSVYSRKSIGIGEFGDLKLLVDWCAETGMSIIQLLPMNEVGSTSCPYDAVSSFAIEPSYISLDSIPGASKKPVKSLIDDLKKSRPAGKKRVDYRIREEKIAVLWEAYLIQDEHKTKEFKKFIDENSYWINDYALFKTLKDFHEGRPWQNWEERYKTRDGSQLEIFWRENEKEILFYMWVQWIAFKQFTEAKRYAGSKHILVKGDLPILISLDSADVWSHSDFFKLNLAAGAPPDMYCAKGQRWGMPTYNWEAIASGGYTYLKEKLKFAENFYDILRVDHVVGLFRIWSIPQNDAPENAGLNGYFDPSNELVWEGHGKKILSVMLESTSMLLCAEDLGMIPKACPKTLKEFGIPGNDVQRWVKDWEKRHDFLGPEEYRLLSVTMLSTHDTTNWPAWWENEAGTIDEALFIRKCRERGIDDARAMHELFSKTLSKHGRLRWLSSIDSTDKLIGILGKKAEELADFIDMYVNSYSEKEKLWKHLGLKGPMRESSDKEILKAVIKFTLDSKAVFCIHSILDWLELDGILKGDAYKHRINTPGTVSADNWSLVIGVPLEDLADNKVTGEIKRLISAAGR